MKKEEKELLLKDLCGRLPYWVRVKHKRAISVLSVNILFYIIAGGTIPRPYLRPMSSMTEEEKQAVHLFVNNHQYGNCSRSGAISDYLNSIHVDYRGLIEKGLALEAPEGMYNF